MAGNSGIASRTNGAATGTASARTQTIVIKKPASQSLASKFSSLLKAFYASLKPAPKYPYQPGNDDQTPQTGLGQDIERLGFKDYETLLRFLNAAVTGINNDNSLLQEGLIQVLAKLPPHSKEGKELADGFIGQLWGALDHPPISSLGPNFKYREADGSCNNIHLPLLGAANTPYARTTSPMTFQNPNLPDPGQIFDSLLARGDTFEGHPNGISSMLFYLATIIIHDIFQTSSGDFNINLTSSYLDLSPLYGRNKDEQESMRLFKDGLIKPDCFSSKRILGFPPGCGVFLIMFNRFHNYVVKQLALINEGGRFNKPSSSDPQAAWTKYDNDLFQTGRLITCGLYVNIVLRDYVRTILSLNRTDSIWALDPRTKDGKNIFSKGVPEGVGNQVSAEFNLIYRWHSTISPRDEKWTVDELERLIPGRDPSTLSMPEVLGALGKFEATLPVKPEEREFAGLSRLTDGTFSDDSLVTILTESIEDLAGSFGPNRVPTCLKTIEMLGIIQARYWNVATLNELREFFGLTKHTTFEDINPDPKVVEKLKHFYDAPDSVELYPGLLVEKTKPPMTPGSGLCVNYTTSWAILSDATALVRGDRFYTIDYTPKNITNWGFNEANYDTAVDGGHVMSKLIYRAFPKHFVNNSIYAHFPFVIPSENRKICDEINRSHLYSWASPRRQGDLIMIRSNAACRKILDDQASFKVTYGEAIEYVASPPSGADPAKNFCLAGDGRANSKNREHITKALYQSGWRDYMVNFYTVTAARLFEQYGSSVTTTAVAGVMTREIDIVRDVIGLATTSFMSALFNLPLKTQLHPHGIYSEQQMFSVLVLSFSAIFLDADIASSFKLRNTAHDLVQQLGSLVMLRADLVAQGKIIDGLANMLDSLGDAKDLATRSMWPKLRLFGDHMIDRMLEKGHSVGDIVWGSIMPMIAAGTANQTQILSQAIDYYLGDGNQYLAELYRLAHLSSEEADEQLARYMLEGCRLRGTVGVYREVASEQTITDFSPCLPNPQDPSALTPVSNPDPASTQRTFTVPAGTRLFVNTAIASHDAVAFPDPENVRLDRPIESYIHYGWGPHECLGRQASIAGLTALFKVIVGKKSLRRAAGPLGQIKSFPLATWNGQIGDREVDQGWTGLRMYMTADQSSYSPLPSTMKVVWDD